MAPTLFDTNFQLICWWKNKYCLVGSAVYNVQETSIVIVGWDTNAYQRKDVTIYSKNIDIDDEVLRDQKEEIPFINMSTRLTLHIILHCN